MSIGRQVRDVKEFVRNVWVFRKALYSHRNWDYAGLLMFMETAITDMSEAHKDLGESSGYRQAFDTSKEMRVVVNCLNRVRKDDYIGDKLDFNPDVGVIGSLTQKPNTLPSKRSGITFYKMVENQRANDLALALGIIKRKVMTWWM